MKTKIFKRITAAMLAATMAVTSVSASASEENYEIADVECVDCGEWGYIPDAGFGTPVTIYPRDSSYLFYLYPDGSYFSNTGNECTCHGNGKGNPCSWTVDCDCMNFQSAIQCAGFAKKVYYETHNSSLNLSTLNGEDIYLTAATAKNIFLNTTRGTCLKVKTSDNYVHYISIIVTSNSSLTVYHANYGGSCLVRYEAYTWENFVRAFPYLYGYKE